MQNESGIHPTEFKILVKLDKIEAKTEGGLLYKPEMVQEAEEWAQTRGTLMDFGGNAFEGWKPPLPQRGQRVVFAKYAGVEVKGIGGDKFRVMNDKDIAAILEPQE